MPRVFVCVAELTRRDHSCVVVHRHQGRYHAFLNLLLNHLVENKQKIQPNK